MKEILDLRVNSTTLGEWCHFPFQKTQIALIWPCNKIKIPTLGQEGLLPSVLNFWRPHHGRTLSMPFLMGQWVYGSNGICPLRNFVYLWDHIKFKVARTHISAFLVQMDLNPFPRTTWPFYFGLVLYETASMSMEAISQTFCPLWVC